MIKSVCGYCGVGCGIEFDEKKLVGDISYPTNEGKLCAKGASELHTIDLHTRLLKPKRRTSTDNEFKEVRWEEAISLITDKLSKTKPEKIGFYLSGQMLTEDYYIANKFAKGFLGCANVDTNSRTCMASAVVAMKKSLGADFVPVSMNDIDDSDLLILAGSNTAEAHVVFHNRIKRCKKNGLRLIVIDPRKTETTKLADLHLQIRPGSDIDLYNLLTKKLIEEGKVDLEFIKKSVNGYEKLVNSLKRAPTTKLLKRTGISKEDFEKFYEIFTENDKIITGWTMGINQSVQGVDKNFAIINTHLITGKIFKKGCGPLSLTGQPNAMGGREVGGLSTMLAVHLDYEKESIEKVKEFWQAPNLAEEAGLTATEMLSFDLDILFVMHTDPVYHLPNRNKTERQIKNIPFIVEINAYEDSETGSFSHVKLPAAPWGEKEGTQTNLDRTVTKQEKVTRLSTNCKPDWEIFMMIAKALGFGKHFDYSCPEDIFNEYKEMTRLSPDGHLDICKTSYKDLENNFFIWGEEALKKKEFFTKDGKANLFAVSNKNLSEKTSLNYPFVLITGRTRDQWHSGTKTGHMATLRKYKDQDFIEINQNDAEKMDIHNGAKIVAESARGRIILPAVVSNTILEGVVFIPVTAKEVNYLTLDLIDPLSKQPDYNMSAVKISKADNEFF